MASDPQQVASCYDPAQGYATASSRCDSVARLVELSYQASSSADREAVLQSIGEETLRRSAIMKGKNFKAVALSDLVHMADLYDEKIFDGELLSLARRDGLSFRWSRRMTSAGGKTTRFVQRASRAGGGSPRTSYEITLSSSLLFQTFQESDRSVKVCGRLCEDRLTAMQRILEHELTHLLEMLLWIDSNCAARRFQEITGNLFAHTEHRHELITQQERAHKQFNVRPGVKVEFRFEGKVLNGIVNRITRRATVLVEDPQGAPFSDGKRYRKYYVPLTQLIPK